MLQNFDPRLLRTLPGPRRALNPKHVGKSPDEKLVHWIRSWRIPGIVRHGAGVMFNPLRNLLGLRKSTNPVHILFYMFGVAVSLC